MISAGDFRNGLTLEIDNAVFQVIEFQHVKPGKGAAFVRTKLKNIKSGVLRLYMRNWESVSTTSCLMNFRTRQVYSGLISVLFCITVNRREEII